MNEGRAMPQTTMRERSQLTEAAKPSTQAAPVAPAAKRSFRPFLILGAMVLLGLAALDVHLLLTADQENTDDAQIEADVITLAPRAGGYVKQMPMIDNQHVKQGQVLLQVDDTDLKLRV